MSRIHPYQPVLLRLLHGVATILLLLALVTGFWVYDIYDKRWGSLALPVIQDMQGIHGTIALVFLLSLPIFAFYSFRIGYRRLIEEQSLSQLKQLGRPVWWMSLHRSANTLMLLSSTLAVVTGRMMKEAWLPAGELNHVWYLAHLLAWVCVFISLILHLLMGAKVGGVPLLLSIFSWKTRTEDSLWPKGIKTNHASLVLKVLEITVIGSIALAFILPAFSS